MGGSGGGGGEAASYDLFPLDHTSEDREKEREREAEAKPSMGRAWIPSDALSQGQPTYV